MAANVAGSIFSIPPAIFSRASPTAEAMGSIDKPASLHFFDAASMIAVACCTMRVSEPRNFDDSASVVPYSPTTARPKFRIEDVMESQAPLNVFFNSPIMPPIRAVWPAMPSVPSSMPSASAWMAHPDSTAPSLMASFISSMDLPDLLARICRACTPLSDSDHISSRDTCPWACILPRAAVMAPNPSWPLPDAAAASPTAVRVGITFSAAMPMDMSCWALCIMPSNLKGVFFANV